jgi:3-oxoadipate enol-lactonase
MSRRVDLDGLGLAVEERPGEMASKDAVVFVHGLGGSSYSWWAQLAACESRGQRAVAYDQRGAGRSDKPPGPYSVASWADDLVGLLDLLEIDRATLIGHSVGCMIAEQAAARLGRRALGLVMIGGGLRWRPESAPVFAERVELALAGRMDEIAATVARTGLSDRCRESDPALAGLMRHLIASNDPVAYAAWSAATAEAEMVDPDRVACPALAVCGELDPVAPPAFAETIASAIPDCRTAVVPGAAHWCQLEAPGALNEVLTGFLAELAT